MGCRQDGIPATHQARPIRTGTEEVQQAMVTQRRLQDINRLIDPPDAHLVILALRIAIKKPGKAGW